MSNHNNDQNTTVEQLRKIVAVFVAERDWEQFHDAKNLASSIAIETAELMEHFQWVRSDQLETIQNDPVHRAGLREELADVVAYVLAFANATGIDITEALEEKMVRNAQKYPADQFYGKYKA